MSNNISLKKKGINKTGVILILSIIIAISALLAALLAYRNEFIYNDFSKVAMVNGEPVYVREYKMRLKSNSNEGLELFSEKNMLKNDSDLLSSSLKSKAPDEVVKQNVLEDIIRIKVQQKLAMEKGIIDSTDYKDFLKELEKENEKRNDAIKNNKVIYGPENYGEIEYYSYKFDNMVKELKNKLKESEFLISESEIKEMYLRLKESRFKIPDGIEIQAVIIPFVDEKGIISDEKKKNAEQLIEEAKMRIEKGESFEKIANAYKKHGEILDHYFTKEEQLSKNIPYPEFLQEAKKLIPGQVSDIIERTTDYSLLICKSKEEWGYVSYEEASKILRDEQIEKEYEEYIDELVKEADVQINEKIFNRINVQK
ncbi:MAG TPA: peptidylprolyl isomerase [Acetivibrio sp.]|nr:peptidylprolyl isomerase [Clostridium sp.]HQA56792.1 peptidylprolyl isomerase [Acetivibrio sp.]